MSDEDVQLVVSMFAEALQETGHVEMRTMIEDDEVWARNAHRFDPDAEIRFITPDGGGVGAMGESFRGIEGLRAGWREWMEPWDEFHVELEGTEDSGGQVLLLAQALGRMPGTGTEVPQEVAMLCRVGNGKVAAIDFYLDQDQARRDAGLT